MATKKSSKLKKSKARDFVDEIAAAPALLSKKQLMSIERRWRDDSDDNQYRRTATALLTMTGADIIAVTKKDREFAVALADTVLGAGATAKRYRLMAKVIDDALLRATVALCHRKDVKAVWREAEAT